MLKKTDCSAKISEIESKIPNISCLATKFALTAVKNKILDVSGLEKKKKKQIIIQKLVKLKKTSLIIIMTYITAPEFNKFTAEIFAARFAQEYLVTKTDFDTKLISLNRKIKSNETKYLLVENKLKKLQTFDSSYFRGKNDFEEDGTQNYLVFQPMYKYFKKIGNTDHISE